MKHTCYSHSNRSMKRLNVLRGLSFIIIGIGMFLIMLFMCMVDSDDLSLPFKLLGYGTLTCIIGSLLYNLADIRIRIHVQIERKRNNYKYRYE